MVFLCIILVDPTPELGSFPKEASHASSRAVRLPVRPFGASPARAAPSRQSPQALAAPSYRGQRNPVDPPYRCPLARSARTLRQMELRVPPLPTVAPGWHLDTRFRDVVGRTRQPRADRPRPVVHRWHHHPCRPLRRRGAAAQPAPAAPRRRVGDGSRRAGGPCVGLLP